MATRKKTTRKKKSKPFAWKQLSFTYSHPLFSKLLTWSWILAGIGLISFVLLWVLVSSSQLPDTQALENPKYEIASLVYTSDGEEMGRYFEKNRDWTSYDDLNENLVNALVATEDERFFSHNGIDFRGTMRALVYAGSKGGASTITQQLAKLFFTNRSSSFPKRVWQKLKEWVIAIRFEQKYTKQEIIAMYLNKVDFLYNAHGVSSAAETYFGKSQKKLNIQEAATIIGMLKNPSLFNPVRYNERCHQRRNVVLGQMLKNKYIDKNKFNELKSTVLDASNFKRKNNYSGNAKYFRAELTKWLKSTLNDDRYLKADGAKYNIYQDGLKIFTTIDARMQKHAEAAKEKHMAKLQEKYFKRWDGLNPWTYKATDEQAKIRKQRLNAAVYDSDRYRNIRANYLTEVTTTISKEIEDVRLWDADIRRMLTERKKPGHLAKLVRKKVISRAQSTTYKKILKSDSFKVLGKKWNAFQKAVKKSFSKKTRMKVFAYNKDNYKVATMTPLDSIKYHRMHMQIGSMSMEPGSGFVKTWVGGVNHDYFKFDHIRSDRQVGSTFKPFVYTSAIFHKAMSPCQTVKDIQYAIPAGDPHFGLMKTYKPGNYNEEYTGEEITLKEALRLSKNTISVWLMKQLENVEIIRDLAGRMGIDKKKIPPYPSICLGAADLSVMEMTSAYAAFANQGVYTEPIFVTRIEDRNGKIIYSAVAESHESLPEDYNYVMVDMLKHATSNHSHKLASEFGGKTGTTNDYVDGWFMGITPNLVVGTWVGGEENWIKFRNIQDGSGGAMARPFFFEFLQRVEADPKIDFNTAAEFVVPEAMSIELDCDIYNQFKKDDRPTKVLDEDFDENFDEEFEGEFDEEEMEDEQEDN